ncbi:hypothetical protein GGE12_007455 [Rhizobium mongolense]|uniref:Uncharacterized protein n=1 Tax=Rhizobium mongolense TaxID=57676 RepID=A0A7W6WIS6_9HYPH|nr:hypothetical protein [Rhizobium mongolense]
MAHLVIPIAAAQRPPMMEHDRLSGAPILLGNLRAIFRLDAVHDLNPIPNGVILVEIVDALAQAA